MRTHQTIGKLTGLVAGAILLFGCSSPAGGSATPLITASASQAAEPLPSAGPANPPLPAPSALASVSASSPALPVSPVASPAAAAGPPEVSQINIVYATNSGEDEFLSIAQQQGYFQKHGLSSQLTYAVSAASLASLVSGEAQMALSDGVSTTEAVASGAPVKVIAYFDQTNPYAILSGAAYPIADDLRGQTIAITHTGDTSDVSARIGLNALGLQMGQDVTPVQIGDSPARFAALLDGQVAAALDDATAYVDQAQAAGMHVLVNLQAQKIPYAASAVVVRTDWAQSHPNAVEAALKAMTAGGAYYADTSNEPEALTLIGADIGLPPTDGKVQQAYDAYHTRTAGDPYPNPEGIDTILTALRGISPGLYDNTTSGEVIDTTQMQALRNEGYQPSE